MEGRESQSALGKTLAELARELDKKDRQIENKDIWLAIKLLSAQLDNLEKEFQGVKESYVTKTAFKPIAAVVYFLVASIAGWGLSRIYMSADNVTQAVMPKTIAEKKYGN